jgi:tetratricopeptide (TPR) repeat protein
MPPSVEHRASRSSDGNARADFQELEAIASGAAERFDVLRRAADIYRAHGLGADAALLYERALLYRPEDPDSVAGLGAAIAAEGRAARGATLLAHAIELASTRVPPLPTSWMDLELARVLGDHLGDRPAAVARLRAIPDEAPEAIVARGLEGRYRALLGDLAGASLAFARLRERAGRETTAIPWLEEAATFEESRGDHTVAQAHLAAALAIAPGNTTLEGRYRAISENVAHAAGLRAPTPAAPAPAVPEPRPEPEPESEPDETRIEALTRTLQGDPTNEAVVDELVTRLTRAGRSMELLALLSARLEDAAPDRRAELLPRHRAVLESLEKEARAAGRDAEADLFRMSREAT